MDLRAIYDYVVLRDLLGFVFPGAILLLAISAIANAIGIPKLAAVFPQAPDLTAPFTAGLLFVSLSFLLGHVIDLVYRNLLQGRNWFRRPDMIRRVLGAHRPVSDIRPRPLSLAMRKAVSQFFGIRLTNSNIEAWVRSGEAFEANRVLGYWVEKEDPELFRTEVAQPVVQAHFLHASGLAFLFLVSALLLASLLHLVGPSHSATESPTTLVASAALVAGFGLLLLRQGGHKRDVLIEHTFRSFYVLWRRRELRHGKSEEE